MKPLRPAPVDVLAFGPHPDDVEIGAAATLAKEAAAGRSVVVVDLSAGEMGTLGDAQTRLCEAAQAAEILGLRERICLDLPDAYVGTESWHADLVAGVVRVLRPSLVLAPWKEDRHPDHRAAYETIRRALFLSGLARHQSRFPPQWQLGPEPPPAYRPQRVFYYLINSPARPDVLVDVAAHYAKKRAALRAYDSQFGSNSGTPLSADIYLPGVEGRDAAFGRHCGTPFAEGFVGERFVCLESLLDVVSCR